MRIPHFFLLLFTAVFYLNLSAVKAQTVRFRTLPLPKETHWGNISAFAQDRQGYLWLATQNGLHRYNGYEFTSFLPNPSDTNSLASTWVESIAVDNQGMLWLGTFNAGLDRFDPATGTFTHYKHNPKNQQSLSSNVVTALLWENDSTLWVGTHNGLNRLNPITGVFKHYQSHKDNPNSLSNDQVRVIYKDRQGSLWIGTGSPFSGETPQGQGGLNRYHPQTDSFTRYLHDPGNIHSLLDNKVRAIFEDSRGTFWIGTYGDGLHTMDRKTGTFTRHSYDKTKPDKLSRPYTKEGLAEDGVSFIIEDQAGAIWIGAYKSGVNRYDPLSQTLTRFEKDLREQGGLQSNDMWSAFVSGDGVLWMGTTESNLFFLDPSRSSIEHVSIGENIRCEYEDTEGGLWLGTANGLLYQDKHSGQITRYLPEPGNTASISDKDVWAIYGDKQGYLWIGTAQGGLNRFDAATKKFTRYVHDPAKAGSIGNGPVYALFEDSKGTFWVGSGDAINRFDRHKEKFVTIYNEEDKTPRPAVFKIVEDKQGEIWCAFTYPGGLDHYDQKAGKLKSYTSNVVLASIAVDASGELWVGTQAHGLYRWDYQANKITPFADPSTGELIPGIYNLIEDKERNLWIGTRNGIIRLNPKRNKADKFTKLYGVEGHLLKSVAAYKGPQGKLYFNTQKGYYVFSPEKIKQNSTPPHIVLEEFKLFDKKVNPGENLSLTTLLNQTKKLDLSHEENVFSFAFTGIHFSNPEENQHLYMLENYDDTWRKAGADRTASFHKVPPGKYIFRVKASNSDGIWAEKTIPIEIHPPWWQTTWAYIGYLLAFVAILYALRHYTISRERLKTRLLLKQMEADKLHELEAVRSRFFANISHEFRTPLTLIIGPLEKLLNKPEEQHNHTLYRMMERNASRLQTLINQLLDLSKLEAGSLKLEMHPGNVETFLHVVSAPFASIAESRNITFHTHIACAETVVLFDSDKVEKIVVNLLSNAFKFTLDGGTIHLHASLNPTAELDQIYLLEIIVSDNGIGIAPNLIDKIFDRFYQIDGSHTREKEGTGIGLSLTKELVELHKGSIDVTSESGKGTSFTVRLPLQIHQVKSPDMVSLVGQINKRLPPSGVQVSKDEHISTADDLTGESETIQEKPLLLIIEDNKELSTFIASHFKPQYEVLIAADGQVGLQQALASAPDIIISDVMMPVMDGIALCKRLKADERTSHIPIILLTAKASESSKLEGLHTGADDYLTKPFKGAELQARVHNLIESRKQLRDKFSREVKLQPAEVLITSADETLLMNIMSILEANFMDPTFSLESFEKKAGMSRTQFYRKMKALTNEAPGEFLRNFRLQKAAMLLKGSYGNISEIAYGVGFNSLSYFTRCFKEFYGQSPSEYIAAQGNKTPVTDPSLT